MRVPTDEEILALHDTHARTRAAFDVVYTHCQIVCAIAEQLLASADPRTNSRTDARTGSGIGPVDIGLVRAGCLLHDIGVYKLYDDTGRLDEASYIRHGVLGYELLAAAGLPAGVCRFASCHTGVGITREDVVRQGLPLPEADYVAETPEELVVMYADKFHSKSDPPKFLTPEAYAASVRRFGEEKVTAFKSMRALLGDPDLSTLSAACGHPIEGLPAR
jgi:uncharacterized protein